MVTGSTTGGTTNRPVSTLAVVLVMLLVPLAGVSFGQTTAGNAGPGEAGNTGPGAAGNAPEAPYVAVQGDQCTPVRSFTGEKSAKAFYDYRVPFENPYRNATGSSFSSEGTVDLQQASTSIVFFYRSTNGTETRADDTVSLVFVHGNYGNADSVSGSASFNISGLPADGSWTVRDDDFEGGADIWTVEPNRSSVDWTWANQVTDGGAYSGLGSDAVVTVTPAFNEQAALYGQEYGGLVEQWQVLSNDTVNGTVTTTRTNLTMTDRLVLSGQGCDAVSGDDTEPPEPTPTPTETPEPTPTPTATPTGTETTETGG